VADSQTGGVGPSDIRPFEVRVERRGKTAILRLLGEFDIAGAGQLDACIKESSRNSPDEVVIDLSGVTFLDSRGLRSLIRTRELGPEAGWSLKLVRGPEQVQKIFELTGLDAVFEFANASDLD
jgi:anti-anti-sigma factor